MPVTSLPSAARNMGGDPIPGEHWVEVDLQGLYHVSKLMIDWEVAYSADWTVKVMLSIFYNLVQQSVLKTSGLFWKKTQILNFSPTFLRTDR